MTTKATILMALAISMLTTISGIADIGVVDMERLIKLHPRTGTDRSILEQYVEDFQAEREEMMAALEKETVEFEELRKATEDVSLSEKALEEKRSLAKSKVIKIRKLERDLRSLASERQKQLTSEELRMRKRVVSELRKIVEEIAKKKKLDLVIDSTGVGIGGYNQVIYHTEKQDITDAVIAKMPKSKE